MEEILNEVIRTQSAPLFFTVALFFAAIVGMGLSIRHRVALIYTYCLLMGLFGAVDATTIAVGSGVVLFLVLEVFNPDERLVKLFPFRYKLWDFIYRLICELYGFVFYALVYLRVILPVQVASSAMIRLVLLLSAVALAAMTVRGKFSSVSVTRMLDLLMEAGGDPACFEFSDSDREKLEILIYLEDGRFLSRNEHEHTITVRYALSRVKARLKRCISSFSLDRLKSLIRGYGTIEMQLLRNIGLEFGSYRLAFRRKVFEWVFARTLFNSYLDQLDRESFARKNYRYWILKCYLNIVSVKIGSSVCRPQKGCSTFRRLFGKEFSALSREEFFVWCLGLPNYTRGVGEIAVSMHRDAIDLFRLDERQINRALAVAHKNLQAHQEGLSRQPDAGRHQAEGISAWFEEGPEKGRPQNNSFAWQYVVLRNNSSAPVYNVIVTCVSLQGAGPATKGEDNGGEYPCRCFVAELPPGTWGVWLPTYGLGMGVVLAPEVAFTDADGVSWVRRGGGLLEETGVDPVTFYGVGLPCPWGSYDRVGADR